MADIDIVPKQRSSMWLWVTLAIVLAALLLIWWAMQEPAPVAFLAPADAAPVVAAGSPAPLPVA
jgi:hypothetical protein